MQVIGGGSIPTVGESFASLPDGPAPDGWEDKQSYSFADWRIAIGSGSLNLLHYNSSENAAAGAWIGGPRPLSSRGIGMRARTKTITWNGLCGIAIGMGDSIGNVASGGHGYFVLATANWASQIRLMTRSDISSGTNHQTDAFTVAIGEYVWLELEAWQTDTGYDLTGRYWKGEKADRPDAAQMSASLGAGNVMSPEQMADSYVGIWSNSSGSAAGVGVGASDIEVWTRPLSEGGAGVIKMVGR